MGDGHVIESGKHDELLRRKGAYHRLVKAQRLRETVYGRQHFADEDIREPRSTLEQHVPLRRRNPAYSVIGEIMQRRQRQTDGVVASDGKGYSLAYLAKRMFALVPDKRKHYCWGIFFALGGFQMFYFAGD